MSLAQATLNAYLRLGGTGRVHQVARSFVRVLRIAQLRFHDPDVEYTLAGQPLTLPFSHDLPYYRRVYPQYSTNVARIAHSVAQKYSDLAMIDIGANVGDTAALVRSTAQFPILCIEPNPRFAGLLAQNTEAMPDVTIGTCFVGPSSETIKGMLTSDRGSAHVVVGTGAESSVELVSLGALIELYPAFAQPRFVKSDTDGFDCQIMGSIGSVWAQAPPVVFFEYDPDATLAAGADARLVFDRLTELDYRQCLVYDNTGDFMMMIDIRDRSLVADLHAYYSGRNSRRYADLCVFHDKDSDVAESLRSSEITYFEGLRGMPARRLRRRRS